MVYFFHKNKQQYFLVQSRSKLRKADLQKLQWLFGGAELQEGSIVEGFFVGPRKEMITPWSTNAVEITQNGMCVDTSDCYTSNYVGVASLNNEMFSIKPNPSSGIFALSFSSSIALKNIQIDIFDITGNVLYQMTKPQNTSTQIDISNQPKGVYFLQIKSDDMVETKRIILK
jgi:hypothetical protein